MGTTPGKRRSLELKKLVRSAKSSPPRRAVYPFREPRESSRDGVQGDPEIANTRSGTGAYREGGNLSSSHMSGTRCSSTRKFSRRTTDGRLGTQSDLVLTLSLRMDSR